MSNGVDADFFSPDPLRSSPFPPGEQAVVFTGAMDYWPSIDGVRWFVAEKLPRQSVCWPRARFHIVGRSPSAQVQALAGERVEVTGTVPDVQPYLQQAAAVVEAIRSVDASLAILTQPGAVVGRLAAQAGLRVFHEAFADRAYNVDGTLVSRREKGAVLHDATLVAQRMLRLVREGVVEAIDGSLARVDAQSICVHGDSASAVEMAQAVRAALEQDGVVLRSFVDPA